MQSVIYSGAQWMKSWQICDAQGNTGVYTWEASTEGKKIGRGRWLRSSSSSKSGLHCLGSRQPWKVCEPLKELTVEHSRLFCGEESLWAMQARSLSWGPPAVIRMDGDAGPKCAGDHVRRQTAPAHFEHSICRFWWGPDGGAWPQTECRGGGESRNDSEIDYYLRAECSNSVTEVGLRGRSSVWV